ncbi:MAG: helix-turn-helix transcriptional regulator, partial [Anaerolineales bacterium]|nr:helix-turn-helix transcriptional regulator [Anaerolineales bacterium]
GTSGLRPLLWRCHAARAAAHLARDDRAAAEAALEAAKEQIASLAAAIPDAARRAHFAQAAAALLPDLPPLTTLQARKLAYDGLTRRERQIAALIAQGKSNPEIADELVIAVRTVKSHVTNILNKLNMSARTQIAAWAAEKGLLP